MATAIEWLSEGKVAELEVPEVKGGTFTSCRVGSF